MAAPIEQDDSDSIMSLDDLEERGPDNFENMTDDEQDFICHNIIGQDDQEDDFLGFLDQEIPQFSEEWDRGNYVRPNPIPEFTGKLSVTNPLVSTASVLDYFNKFISDEVILDWIQYTDDNARAKIAEQPEKNKTYWKIPCLEEMKVFLSILLATNYGLSPARLDMLWCKKSEDWFFHTPGFWKVCIS